MSPKLTNNPITFAGSVLAGCIFLTAAAYQVVNTVTEPRVESEPQIGAATASDWSKLPNIKNARFESTAIQYQDDLYVFNGFGKGIKVETRVEKFDAQSLNWSVISNTSVAKGNAVTHNGFVVNGNEVWIIGGRLGNHPGAVTSKVWKFNLDTFKWSAGPELPVPGAAGGAALVDNRIHWFGGLDTQARCDVDNHYVYDLTNPSAGWSDITGVAPMPVPRNHFATVVLDGLIYAIGGQFTHDGCGAGTPDTDLSHVYDPRTKTWDQIDNLPAVQSHIEPSTFVYKGAIYVVGGATNGTKVFRYDPSKDRWDSVAQLPQALLAPIARVVNNELVVSSGGAPSIVPSSITYKTNMTPLLLPGANNAQADDESESESTNTNNTDTAEQQSAPTDSDTENNDIADTPDDVTQTQQDATESSETSQNDSVETGSTEEETEKYATETDSNQPDTTASVATTASDTPTSPQSDNGNHCDYSNASVNNGWGWDSIAKVSCPPLPVVVTQDNPVQPSSDDNTNTDEENNSRADQLITEQPSDVTDSGNGSTDHWLITLLLSLFALRIICFTSNRRVSNGPQTNRASTGANT